MPSPTSASANASPAGAASRYAFPNATAAPRARTLADWIIDIVLCGGGGAVLGAYLALLILSRVPVMRAPQWGWYPIAGLALVGFFAGTFGGVRGIEWIGRKIRDRENS